MPRRCARPAITGDSHPEVAITLNNLAMFSRARGRLAEARRHLRRALAIFAGPLGPRHPHTRLCATNLSRTTGP